MKGFLKKFSCLIITILSLLFLSNNTHAFFITKLLQGPVQLPMPDPADEVASTMQTIVQTTASSYKTYNSTQNQVNNMRTALNSVYDFEFSAVVDGRNNPGNRKISQCKINGEKIDIYNAASIEKAFQFLFFEYPYYTAEITSNYDNNRKKFYQDNLVEFYTASQQLELDMEERVKPIISSAAECVRNGGCGIPSSDGNTESLYALSKALEAMDNILMLIQKAEALKAQFTAVKAMNKIEPIKYQIDSKGMVSDSEIFPETDKNVSTEEQEASLPSKIYAYAKVGASIKLAFAQINVSQTLLTAENSDLKKDSSQNYIDRLIFNTAPSSEISHPYLDEEGKMSQLDKLNPVEENVTLATEVHNTIHDLPNYKKAAERYNEIKEKYNQTLKSLQASEKCVLSYISRHFENADATWAGGSFIENPAAHDFRKGISGWAIEAFETAKAAKSSSSDTDNIVLFDIDEDETDLSDISNTAKAQDFLEKNKSISASTSQQEKTLTENREISLISWQVGSEASKLLAENPEKWGTIKENFPIWNDTKSFYNQYLSKKYNNIKNYLKMFSKEDIIAIVISRLQGTDKDPLETLQSKENKITDAELSEKITILSQERNNNLQDYEQNFDDELKLLQNKRATIQAKLDEAYKAMKTAGDKLSDLRQEIKDNSIEELRNTTTKYEGYPETNTKESISPQAYLHYKTSVFSKFRIAFAAVADVDELNETYQNNVNDNKQKYEKQLTNLKQEYENQKQKVEEYEKELKIIDDEINRYKIDNQTKLSDIQKKYNEGLISASYNATTTKSKTTKEYTANIKANLDGLIETFSKENKIKNPLMFSGLEDNIEKILDSFYEKVDQRINQAQNELAALGNDLYKPSSHDKIVKIHENMINDIKLMSLSLSAIEGLESMEAIQLYAKLLSADISAEEEDYFVGNPSKERDLKAPKQIFEQNLPPLREVIHFDEIDFQNVMPYVKGTKSGSIISPQKFLNYGGYIPLVWKYMLRSNAFVEKEMDLKDALNRGCPEEGFFRGGVYPCKVKDSAFVIDINANGNFIKSNISSKDLSECPNLEVRKGNIYHIKQEVYLDLDNTSFIKNSGIMPEIASANCQYSELGSLLDADGQNNVFFREGVFNAFYTLIEIQNNAEKDLSDSQKKQLAQYENSPLAVNQIGDFLTYVENEQNMRKTLEELNYQYEQMIKNLKDILQKYGYETKEDINLSKESDYELLLSKLDNIKNQKITESLSAIEEVDITDNPVVEERLESFKSIILALQQDEKEQIIITSSIVEDNNIDEEIKSSKVNKEVTDKFEDSLNKFEQIINSSASPYCANY